MKKYLLTLLLALFSVAAFAQVQQGVVKTRGRMVNGKLVPGLKLSGATITLNFGNPLKSGQNGAFTFNVPAGKSFSLVSAKKQGYTLADAEFTRRTFKFSSSNPFYVVLEDEAQRQADIKEATDKVRKTLKRELRKREDELDELRESNAITQAKYDSLRMEFATYRQSSEALVNEMAERFAAIDYDQLDEFNRQVQQFIEEGELLKADSLINTRGSLEERYARVKEQENVNTQREEEIRAEQESLAKSQELTQREKDDLMSDLYAKHTIYLQAYQQDSALYCMKMRADLDTTNVDAVWDYAYLCYEQKKFEDCENYYLICLRAYLVRDDLPNIAAIQNNLGILYSDLHDYQNSEKYYLLALENYEQLFNQNPDAYRVYLASTQNNLGVLYDDLHDYQNSEKYHLLALENREQLFGQNPDAYRADLAATQNNLGNLYWNLHDYQNSEKYFLLALENYEQLFNQNPDAYRVYLASTQNNLGVLYDDLHDYQNSEKYYLLALENKEQLFRQNPDAYRADLAATQNNLGILYHNLHDYQNSEKYYLLALENKERLFRLNPKAYRADLAVTQNNLGSLYRDLHDYQRSEKYYLLALENREQLFGQNPDAYRADLARTQNNLGNLYSDLHDYQNSEKYHLLALENKEQLFRQNPDAYRADLAATQNSLGNLYSDLHDYQNSEKYHLLALENREQLFGQSPDAYRAALAMTQDILGILYYNLHDYQNSEKYYMLALENKEQLFRQNPDAYRADLASTYWNMMLLYADMEIVESYDKHLEKALELYQVLYEQQPSLYKDDVIELQSSKVWRLLINGSVEEALTLAQKTYAMDESNEQSKAYLARCYNSKAYENARKSDYKKAHEFIDKAISLMPENPDFYDSKGEIFLMQGRADEALEMWKKVLELDPNFLDNYPDGTNLSNGLKERGLIE